MPHAKLTILFLAANPVDMPALQLDEELRAINAELQSGTEVRTLSGHRKRVNAVAVTAGGRAVSASWDKTSKV